MRCYSGTSRAAQRGFTLIEAVFATVIVGVMLAAALQTVAVSARLQAKSGDKARGTALADALMSEILAQAYEDPNGSVLFGREVGEGTTTRSSCDHVDDYNGWSES